MVTVFRILFNSICENYGYNTENAYHSFFDCPKYNEERLSFLSNINARLKTRGPWGHFATLSNNDFIWVYKGYCAIWPLGRKTKKRIP